MLTNSKTYIPILTKKCKAHQGIFFGIPYFSKKEAQTSIFSTQHCLTTIKSKGHMEKFCYFVALSKMTKKIKVLFLHWAIVVITVL